MQDITLRDATDKQIRAGLRAVRKQKPQASPYQNFGDACLAAARLFRSTGQQLVRESEAAGEEPRGAAFWFRLDADARKAARIYQALTAAGRQNEAACYLRVVGLHYLADVLESGDFSQLTF